MPIPDDFANVIQTGFTAPYTKAIAVTPADNTDLTFVPRAFYVGGTGALSLLLVDGVTTVVLPAVPAGTVIHIRALRVRSTGGGATNIVALA